jgi:phospholipase C
MAKIENVVVLMLENRSFDHALGWLNQDRPEIDGPSSQYTNPVLVGSPMPVQYAAKPTADWAEQMAFDPPHEFADVTEHIFGTSAPFKGQPEAMNGFVQRAARANSQLNAQGDPGSVMLGFGPGRLPALHALANEFAICQRWFSSVPGSTWPNRFFAHCASAGGYLDGKVRPYTMPSVFRWFDGSDYSAKIYFDDVPHCATLTDVLTRPGLLHKFATFLTDARDGLLPNYSFVEPNYNSFGGNTNADDQHPTGAMQPGDQLIARVYRALRTSPQWEKSLLLIVWDEHGGFFDHVPPPTAVPPGDGSPGQYGFAFDRLGVRVPAVLVSPWVPRGHVDNTTFEHASIPATLSALFGFEPLTQRDRMAASFDGICSLDQPRTDAPMTLPTEPTDPPPDDGDIDLGTSARRRAAGRRRKRKPLVTKLQTSMQELHADLWNRHGGGKKPRAAGFAGLVSIMNKASKPAPHRKVPPRPVLADKVDLRDRTYMPRVTAAPPLVLKPPKGLPKPLDQKNTEACTGYSLAALIEYLLTRAERTSPTQVSPRMLYSMARRYDDWPGSKRDEGSSCRGALKGWFRHGVCRLDLWPDNFDIEKMPAPNRDPKKDWWADALLCPLGAYYRIDTKQIADLQCALADVGAIYVSAVAHSGWDKGDKVKTKAGEIWEIPLEKTKSDDGGHAFILIGYDDAGFYLQNSWGDSWASHGIARITYEDWLANAMDAWVVQLGVPTAEHKRAAAATGLRASTRPANDPIVRDHQISPYIIDTERGRLSNTGRFRTGIADLDLLTGQLLDDFQKEHKLPKDQPIDVAIYAHGGVVSEDTAAESARRWVPALFEKGIFPIFVMWESDVLSSIEHVLADKLGERRTGGAAKEWVDQRIERLAAPLGTPIWSDMKASARALTMDLRGALRMLFGGTEDLKRPLDKSRIRLHLIGHSAGAIVHSTLAAWLIGRGFPVTSMTFLAPAIRVDEYDQLVGPHVGAEIDRLRIYYLRDSAESTDSTIPIYDKSILYLVSRAFEGGAEVPILGMEKFLTDLPPNPALAVEKAPGPRSHATTHIAFDDDELTMRTVIEGLKPPSTA